MQDLIIDLIVFSNGSKVTDEAIRSAFEKVGIHATIINRDISVKGSNFLFYRDDEVLKITVDFLTHDTRLVIDTPINRCPLPVQK